MGSGVRLGWTVLWDLIRRFSSDCLRVRSKLNGRIEACRWTMSRRDLISSCFMCPLLVDMGQAAQGPPLSRPHTVTHAMALIMEITKFYKHQPLRNTTLELAYQV